MSETIIVARRNLVCDLCGRIIPKGSKCRLIKDDFAPGIAYFEHLRCPQDGVAVTENNQPIQPVKNQCRPMPA